MKRAAFLVALLSAATADASPRLLALDDVYDCAFSANGTPIAATAGGLRIGARIVTALDGLPDTRVERVVVEGDHALVGTRAGTASVELANGRVSNVVLKGEPAHLPQMFERFGAGIVRGRRSRGERTCIATSEGLFVSVTPAAPVRVPAAGLPTGDVAALVATPRGLLIGTFDRGLFRYEAEHVTALRTLDPNINALAYDDGVLWIATARGLTRCEDGAQLGCRRIGDGHAKHTLLVTKDGVLAGGDESLLFVARDGAIVGEATRKRGAHFRSVWSLAIDEAGTIYAGTTNGIFFGDRATFLHAPEKLKRVSLVDGTLPDDWVTALLVRGDELLAGTYNAGVVALERSGSTLHQRRHAAELGYVNPAGLALLPDGTLAVSTMDGLRVGELGAFRTVPTLGRDVTAVALGTDGTRWTASRRGVAQF